jgi:hypothetical protein
MHLSLMGAEEINDNNNSKSLEQTTHELCKDSMLEKIVLVSVAYFCIATEMRFLMQKTGGGNKNFGQNKGTSSQYNFNKQDSEAFHAQALQISSLFLPNECPLVAHIIKSYKRNYLKDKKVLTQTSSRPGGGLESHREGMKPSGTSSFPSELDT